MVGRRAVPALAVIVSFAAASAAGAQISITPLVGGYIPGTSVSTVTDGAQGVAQSRNGTLSLGADLDLGALRGSFAYASGTTIRDANRQNIGKGNVANVAADLVIRPLPRILVQPYLIAGAGEKFTKVDQSLGLSTTNSQRVFALHGGVGADLMLGGIGVVAELTDFVNRDAAKKWDVHDAFLMAGLKLRL